MEDSTEVTTVASCGPHSPWECAAGAKERAARGWMAHLICCVCLDELDVRTALLLPCCGRADSSTRCCSECLRRCCDLNGSCPACRRVGLRWASGRVYLEEADGHDSTFLGKAWSQLGALGLWMLGVLLHPLDLAFTQALEAVCSRGPV